MPPESSSTMVTDSVIPPSSAHNHTTNHNHHNHLNLPSATSSPPRKPSHQSNQHVKPASTSSDLHARIIAQKREKARAANQEWEDGSKRGPANGQSARSNNPHHHHHPNHSRSNRHPRQGQDDNASISDAGQSTSNSNSARRNQNQPQPQPTPSSSSRLNSNNPVPDAPKAPKASLRAIQRGPGLETRRVVDPEAAGVVNGEPSRHHDSSNHRDRERGGKDRSAGGNGLRNHHQDDTDSQNAPGGRELFDPRKHDPISFQKRGGGSNFPSGSTTSDARSYGASTSNTFATNSVTSASAPSVTSSDASRERRQRRRPGQSENGSEGKTNNSKEGENQEASARNREANETNSYVLEIKKTYREISALETKLQEENRSFVERGRARGQGVGGKMLLSKDSNSENVDHEFWLDLTSKHKKLAETHVTFMELALRPGLPASLHSLPQTYNIPTRLWQTAFHTMLERLRHSLPLSQSNNNNVTQTLLTQQGALLDHLTEFIYYAYSFYSNLHESELFRTFRSSWIESLGDLARYRMAVAGLSASLNSQIERFKGVSSSDSKSPKNRFARIDDEQGDEGNDQEKKVRGADEASIGLAALDDWELEEKETWRVTARDWYATGLAEMPGTGRLHHHLGIMTRMLDEMRALHHFCKSLTTSHPYLAARESILPLFDREHQLRRTQPEASVTDLFVHLHGMLFTRIQLDDFDDVFARFKERLNSSSDGSSPSEVDGRVSPFRLGAGGLSQATWMMMATINIASLLQYGADNALLAPPSPPAPSAGNNESRSRRTDKTTAKAAPTAIMLNHSSSSSSAPAPENGGDGSDEHSDGNEADQAALKNINSGSTNANIVSLSTTLDEDSMPEQLRYAIKLTFFLLEFVLPNSNSRSHSNEPKLLCPYLTMLLTFLTTVLKEPSALRLLEKFVPWEKLSALSSLSPKDISLVLPPPTKINAECPLPEDWSLRGMAWVGRRVYERGFWKRLSNAPPHLRFESEVEVLTKDMDVDPVEDAEDEIASEVGIPNGKDPLTKTAFPTLSRLRWKRALFCISTLCAKHVAGLDLDPTSKNIVIVEPLKSKMMRWKEEEEQVKLVRTQERSRILDDDDEEVEKVDDGISDSEEEEDVDENEDDSEEVKELKARRRYLRGILRAAKTAVAPLSPARPSHHPKSSRKTEKLVRKSVKAVPGYTTLVLDTNILVSPGDLLQQLVESRKWTIVIPLAVITELDGLKHNGNDLAEAAIRSISYLEANIKSMSKWLKVQTSRGNYLSDLRIRKEEIDFSGSSTDETQMARNLDEVILRAVSWQDSHFVDRLNHLSEDPALSRKQINNDTPKAVLITLDRNLRLKAKIKGLTAFASQELTDLLIGTSTTVQKKKPV